MTRWTDEQVEAITSTHDTLLSASAGTGKTTTVVGKILWSLGLDVGRARTGAALQPCPAPITLDQIAAITFTEQGAHDLKDKLRSSIEAADPDGRLRWELERATVGTIHGFAAELLREHALRLGIDPNFRILDPRETEIQQEEIVREILATGLRDRDPGAVALTRRYGLTGWKMSPGAVARIVEVMRDLRWRSRQFDAWSLSLESGPYTRTLDRNGLRERALFAGAWSEDPETAALDEAGLELADALYRLGRASVGGWLTWLERENARDFDSLILDTRRLLTRPETRGAREAIRRRYRLLIIDEFQDTDWAQWEIARALTRLPSPDEAREEPAPDDMAPGDMAADHTTARENTARGPQLFLVGDPKQSIYRFRGAEIDVWNEARRTLEGQGRALELSWNFRSDPQIVSFVNRVAERALTETAAPLERSAPESVVRYHPLRSTRPATRAAALEWLAVDTPGNAEERRAEEARRVASRLHQLIGTAVVTDPDTDARRPCRAGDIAILARRNADLVALEPALRTYGLPFYNTATSGLAEQQEIVDLVTALRLVDNRFDDLRAFAFLRSPFVGLRDEILVRIGLYEEPEGGRRAGDGGSAREEPGLQSLLERAAAFLEASSSDEGLWFPAPDAPEIREIERTALRQGLSALAEAHRLADRLDHAQVLENVLSRTGYRLHLLIREGAAESLANIERFLALLEEFRHLTLGHFLALWARWGEKELGVPQARLYSGQDDVITLSTIHAAKGLEWPVVALVGTDAPLPAAARFVGMHWTDPALGPILMPRKDQRGPRAELALSRKIEQEQAEEARLLYVAATRVRDRLLVAAPETASPKGFTIWLSDELDGAREVHESAIVEAEESESSNGARRPAPDAEADDVKTGTGRQIDAFGLDGSRPQFDLFAAGPRDEPPDSPPDGFVVIRRGGGSLQTAFVAPPVTLAWLARVEDTEWPDVAPELEPSVYRSVSSATERMMRAQDPDAWRLRYLHGVLEPADYLPPAMPAGGLFARTRGTLIHGVLERIVAAEELSRVLQETIAALDLAGLEASLAAGSSYREALEQEIAAVVRSPEWHWYVEGPHRRELRFLHHSELGWMQGAFDLYRPAGGERTGLDQVSLFEVPPTDGTPCQAWIIDFKTHRAQAGEIAAIAGEYAIQLEVYRDAATALGDAGSGNPRVALHFTHANVAIEV